MPLPAVEVVEDRFKGLVGYLDRLAVTVGLFEFVDVEEAAVEIRNTSEQLIELGIARPAAKTFVEEAKQEIAVE